MNRNEKKRQELQQSILEENAKQGELTLQRVEKLENLLIQVERIAADRDYKQMQIDSGKILEKHDQYIDGLKPMWMMKLHIKELNMLIRRLQVQVSDIEQLLKEESIKNDNSKPTDS